MRLREAFPGISPVAGSVPEARKLLRGSARNIESSKFHKDHIKQLQMYAIYASINVKKGTTTKQFLENHWSVCSTTTK